MFEDKNVSFFNLFLKIWTVLLLENTSVQKSFFRVYFDPWMFTVPCIASGIYKYHTYLHDMAAGLKACARIYFVDENQSLSTPRPSDAP